ncbi:MAG TPA: phosphatidate cytidylyltransferase [Candidatus Angelobacter sp.]|nr:phosphatidate cytidylyltransferase [Candidatus Angelobacter sp.]
MKRVLTAVALIPVVLLIVFRAPLWLFALVVAAIIVLALREYLGIAEAAGIKPFHGLTYAVALLPTVVFLLFRFLAWQAERRGSHSPVPEEPLLLSFLFLWGLAPVIFGIPLVFRKELRAGLASAAASMMGFLYVGASLALLIELRDQPAFNILIVFILFSVWGGDIAAYYVGKNFGRHKLAPVVSPNKSWEGAVASILASVLVAFLVFHFLAQLTPLFSTGWLPDLDTWTRFQPKGNVGWRHVIALGVLTNVAAQFGDLFESALKRGAGVKDSGTLLPGHGGMLDRIDALLFAIPAVWYYALLTDFLQPR